MHRPQAPLSPVSITSGSDWSRYNSGGGPYSPTLTPGNSRGHLLTPPPSASLSGMNGMDGLNGMPGKPGDDRGNPSPPRSMRSSSATTMSIEGQRRKQSIMEDSLAQHYSVLKRYLAQSLREDAADGKPNKARDKLLRLSAIQFQELSTDVYDELLRRQSAAGQPPNGTVGVPTHLLPKDNFHPKRNQARQKLSTLPPLRFRALATDVFFELERRFPRFSADTIDRRDSPANSTRGPPSRTGTPSGMRPGSRDNQRRMAPMPRQGSVGGQVLAGLGIPGMGSQDDYNRPTPKSSQSNTVVPNKSYLVEDDGDETDSMYGLNSKRNTGMTNRSLNSMANSGALVDKKALVDSQSKAEELQGKVDYLETKMRDKDATIGRLESGQKEFTEAQTDWTSLTSSLEDKLADALTLNSNLQSELDKVQRYYADKEQDLRTQMDQLTQENSKQNSGGEWRSRYEDLEQDSRELRRELKEQQRVTDEVRREASSFLIEMKAISDRSSTNWEREEKLVQQVQRQEDELKDWKSRYARARTRLGTKTGSISSMPQPNAGQFAKDSTFLQKDGLIKDIHLTKFHIAMDEVLRVARVGEPHTVLDSMKAVVTAVRNICQEVSDTATPGDTAGLQRVKIRARVSATANNFITASKNFAQSKGLSPVSILDAAASHLAAAIVDLVHVVKIRPTPAGELDDPRESQSGGSNSGYFSIKDGGRSSIADSVYSNQTAAPAPSFTPLPTSTYKDYSQAKRAPEASGVPSNGVSSNGIRESYANGKNYGHRLAYGAAEKDRQLEDLKVILEAQTESLVTSIQSLVSSIRTVDDPPIIRDRISSLATIVTHVVKEASRVADTTSSSALREQISPVIRSLAGCKVKLLEKDDQGSGIVGQAEWKGFVGTLPPIAFEIAREVKELGRRVVLAESEGGADDEEDFR